MRHRVAIAVVFVLSAFFEAHAGNRRVQPTTIRRAAGRTSNTALLGRHCFSGCPKLRRGFVAERGPVRRIARNGYVLEHSTSEKIPVWVAEYLVPSQLSGDARRSSFAPDPDLPEGERAELADYKNSGWARGHQAPAADYKKNQRFMDECFYLSNMAPQNGSMNSGMWSKLEERVRTWARSRGGAYVITGGFFYDPREEDPETADGIVKFETIGDNKVAVPTHFFKVVYAKNRATGRVESIAFVAANKPPERGYELVDFVESIAWIEERAGLNFAPELPPAEARRLESTASSLWQ